VILRIADGKIAEEWEMSNLLGLLQQLGAAPSFSLDGMGLGPTAGDEKLAPG
jgi:hypothetical protein